MPSTMIVRVFDYTIKMLIYPEQRYLACAEVAAAIALSYVREKHPGFVYSILFDDVLSQKAFFGDPTMSKIVWEVV